MKFFLLTGIPRLTRMFQNVQEYMQFCAKCQKMGEIQEISSLMSTETLYFYQKCLRYKGYPQCQSQCNICHTKNYNPGYLTVYKADRPEFLKVPGAACPRNNIGPRAGHLGCWILGIYLDTLYTKLGLRQAALGT